MALLSQKLLCQFLLVFVLIVKQCDGVQTSTNGGSDFYLAYSANSRQSSYSSVKLYLYVTTEELDTVHFTVNTLMENKTHEVSPGEAAIVKLNYNTYSCQNELIIENRGIHVKVESNKRISVYAVNYEEFSAEAFVVLPYQQYAAPQYIYYSMSVPLTPMETAQGFALIVACEDSTVVSTPTHTVTLNRLQTYLFRDNNDITGIQFQSNKLISFFSGHECGDASFLPPCFYYHCCGPLVEMIPPTIAWGNTFLTASIPYQEWSEFSGMYRVLAAFDDTHLQVDCVTGHKSSKALTEGSIFKFNAVIGDACVIRADKPVLLVEFGNAYMFIIPPVQLYLNEYSFYVLPSSQNYITIAMLAATGVSPETTHIHIDNQTLVTNWTILHADGDLYGYITTIEITSGYHHIAPANEAVNLHVTVNDQFLDYYGYSAGYDLTPSALIGYCDPPCVHGECSHVSECTCALGYQGQTCDEPVNSQCYVDSCNMESCSDSQKGPPCSKEMIIITCECSNDVKPTTCEDIWSDTNGGCNCTSERQKKKGCSLFPGMVECQANMSTCLSNVTDCTRFILTNIHCNCTGNKKPLNICTITCPQKYSSTATSVLQPSSSNCLPYPHRTSPLSNGANEFYLAFSANARSDIYTKHLSLYVTTAEPDAVEFYVYTLSSNNSYTVTQDKPATISFRYDEYSCQESLIAEDKGIYVKAEPGKTVSVFGHTRATLSAEGFLALPYRQYPISQYTYYSMSVALTPIETAQGFALIVACEDSTVVSTLTHTVTLKRLQTYLFRQNSDITGLLFQSNKPIAFLSGHECGDSWYTQHCTLTHCCGPLVEMIPSTNVWGKTFLAASIPGAINFEFSGRYRIMAAEDDTKVLMSCTVGQTHSHTVATAGSTYDINAAVNDTCVIVSDKPVLVAEFGNTFMTTVPATENYQNAFSFYVMNNDDDSGHFITLSMLPSAVTDPSKVKLYLDDKRLEASWTFLQVNGSLQGFITTISVSSGHHYLFAADLDILIHVSVLDYVYNYYGYPVGYRSSGYCDPPCVHGDCIEGPQCNCSAGYKGDSCDEIVPSQLFPASTLPTPIKTNTAPTSSTTSSSSRTSSRTTTSTSTFISGHTAVQSTPLAPTPSAGCNVHPCLNNGTCKHNATKYTCQCLKGYSGSECQYFHHTKSGLSMKYIITIIVGGSSLFFVLLTLICGIMIRLSLKRSRKYSRLLQQPTESTENECPPEIPDCHVQPRPESDDASRSGGIHQNETGQNLSEVTTNRHANNLSDSEGRTFYSKEDRPNLTDLQNFRHPKEDIKILDRVVAKYRHLGNILLQSPDGSRVKIIDKTHNDKEDAIYEIFRAWLEQDVEASWEKLVQNLRTVGLKRLAREIEENLC